MKNYICALALFYGIFLSAQTGTLKGTTKSMDGTPAPFVNLVLKGTLIGTASDEKGNFVLENVPTGNQVLVASTIGYSRLELPVTIESGRTLEMEILLTESALALQAVEIFGRRETGYDNKVSYAATKTATPIKDIPQAISYVTKEVINDQLAYRVNDIIKNVSGVTQFSYYDDFTFRGFRSGDTYINGLRVLGLFGPQPIIANIERVEIVKGPSSAMFGNSIPGGIMNRVTKKPLSEDRKAINFTTGSYNTLRTSIDFTGPINDKGTLLYRLNLAYENADGYRDLQETKSYMIAPSISFLPTARTRINFDLAITNFLGKLDRGQPIFGATAGTDLNSTPISFAIGQTSDFQKTDVAYSTLSLNHEFSDRLSFNTSYMRFMFEEDLQEHRTSNDFAIDANGAPIPTLMGMQVISRQQQVIADNISSYFVYNSLGNINHKILLGFDYNEQRQPVGNAQSFARGYLLQGGGSSTNPVDFPNFLKDANGNPVPNVPHFDLENPTYNVSRLSDYIFVDSPQNPTKYYSYGFYVQDQIKWNKLQLLLGLRQEYYNDVTNFDRPEEEVTTQHKLLPRMGLVYELNENINVYGTYTESFQPQGVAVQTNPNAGGPFDPVNAHMIETGAKGEFFNGTLSANLAIFHIENYNILVNANDPGNPELLRQRGQEQSKGLELDINGKLLPNLRVTANYSYNEAKITASDIEDEVGLRKENAPLHQGGIFGKYTFENGKFNGISLTLGTNFVSERNTFEQELQLPSYMLLDAGIAYSVDRFNIRFLVNNILNKTHWVGGYSYVRLFPGAPRNYLLSVGYTF